MFGVLVAGLATLAGCYPKEAETLSDTDLVYTNYDTNFDFNTDKTYILVDSIVYDSGATPDASVNAAILNTIITNMNSLGWTRITDYDHPDSANVVILATVITVNVQQVGYFPGYGWGGWWGGWYGGGYPGYGGIPITYNYDVGTLIIDMMDPTTYDESTNPPSINLVWGSVANGVLSSSATANTSRIERVINQAYTQSPYL